MSHRGRYVSGAFYLGGVMTGIPEYSTCIVQVMYVPCSVNNYEKIIIEDFDIYFRQIANKICGE